MEETYDYIFDTHAHYDDAAFDEDREVLLAGFGEQGIGKVANIGANITGSKESIELALRYPFVYAAIGVHPSETAELNEDNFSWLKEHLAEEKVVAIGEIGLDYYWPKPDKEIQKYWFKRQLALAVDKEMPVVIHSRDAAADTLQIMKETKEYANANGKIFTGVIHCFSYGVEMAREYLEMGFYLGIGGVVTFKNAVKIREVVKETPLSRLVIETDSPYLTPTPYRGKRNSSLYLPLIVDEIARIKDTEREEVIRVTCENAHRLYRL